MRLLVFGLLCLASFPVAAELPAAEIPAPAMHFGHEVGADRKLIPYPDVLAYLEIVAAASDRVSIEEAGLSTLGNRMPIVVLTSAANQANLGEIRSIARDLARPGSLSAAESASRVDAGKVVALVTCTIHSTEVGCTQMATELVHEFATTDDPERVGWMDEVVLLLMPSINPDGQVMVVDWYEKWLGTEYEGGRMPWLYQTYVGHDNNRDFYALTQQETQVVNQVLYHRWFPQVFLDEHQMGSSGPRMFVPPQADPLNPEVHSLIFRQADVLGTNMGRRLEEAGKRGVGNDMIFDSYWPGGTRNTAWWKNVTGLLTEVASVRLATPIYVEPGELRGGYKGLPEYKRQSNYPSPWEGGWWRLRDIVDYELIATWAFLESLADDRRDVLRNMDRMARESTERGKVEAPYAFIVEPDQHDPVAAARMVDLLLRHGVEVHIAQEPISVGYATYGKGTIVVPAAQPYRPFLLTMLRPQRYPEVRPWAGGPIIPPYDVTSWSLPISMGVSIAEATEPVRGTTAPIDAAVWPVPQVDPEAAGHLVSAGVDSVYSLVNRLLAAGHEVQRIPVTGDVWIPSESVDAGMLGTLGHELHVPVTPAVEAPGETLTVKPLRVGLFKPWVASMDEGWTRFVLEQYGFPFASLHNEDIRSGAFATDIDVLLVPDIAPDTLSKGRPADEERRRFRAPLPPAYAGGWDEWEPADEEDKKARGNGKRGGSEEKPIAGGKRIHDWVHDGGTVVALDSSADYFIKLFGLPASNVLAKTKSDAFDCPGSTLRVLVDTSHPLGFGMREQDAAYFARSPAFRTSVPDTRFKRRVIARYPDDSKDILVSGYLKGGELLEKRAAVVEYTVGKGRVVLIGFRAQHRAQPLRTFKLLFNALYDVR